MPPSALSQFERSEPKIGETSSSELGAGVAASSTLVALAWAGAGSRTSSAGAASTDSTDSTSTDSTGSTGSSAGSGLRNAAYA